MHVLNCSLCSGTILQQFCLLAVDFPILSMTGSPNKSQVSRGKALLYFRGACFKIKMQADPPDPHIWLLPHHPVLLEK